MTDYRISDGLNVMVDMAGCPNRCRHCWLGGHRNGAVSIEEFKNIAAGFRNWRDENGKGIAALGFSTWWREPDYRDDYRQLWELEKELSSPGRARRFELLSTWRLARDETYARWAASLGPKACQITFFGMQENTDWFMRRRGAFRDQLLATERILAAGILPRWQLFITKRCLGELDDFLDLIYRLDLHRRCEEIGGKFEVFIGGMSPEGSGYEIEDIRPEESDLSRIPKELISVSREGTELLGRTESYWMKQLVREQTPPGFSVDIPAVAVDADYNVYPNIAEPAEWWRLGNLRTDGTGAVIRAFRDGTTPGMAANRSIPVGRLAEKYGDPAGKKLYSRADLICRFLHQWGADRGKGKG